jgi:O-antigen/teichoic acid export membrane protein
LKKLDVNLLLQILPKNERSLGVFKHVGLSFLYKLGTLLLIFFQFSVASSYLDIENYGVYLTLVSFVNWFSLLDFGIGNGLRNKIVEAKLKGGDELVRYYVSTAYFSILCISISLVIGSLVIFDNFDWRHVFSNFHSDLDQLNYLFFILISSFCLQLCLKLLNSILLAFQEHSLPSQINFVTQLLVFLSLKLISETSENSLLLFSSVIASIPVFVLVVYTFFSFNGRLKLIKPSIKYWKFKYVNDVLALGGLFFILQLSGVILYSSDNVIISRLFGAEAVVPYSAAHRLMGAGVLVYSLFAAPYWSLFSDAFFKNDYEWIRKSMRFLLYMALLVIVCLTVVLIFSDFIYRIWLSPEIKVSFSITFLMYAFFVLSILATPYTLFLNGSGKIRIQAIQSFISAIINIPMSIYLASNLQLGINGIILATLICIIPGYYLSWRQYKLIINNSADGIWYR